MRQSVQIPEQATDLYRCYAPAVFAYLLRQFALREDAEDLLLEVFLAVIEKGAALEQDESRLRALIWAVARNKVADYYRRSAQRSSIPLVEIEETVYERQESEPEQVALRQEEYAQLRKALQKLPKLQREIVQLRFGHSLSYKEIALVISKSEGSVRMMLHRSLKLLRNLYATNQTERDV